MPALTILDPQEVQIRNQILASEDTVVTDTTEAIPNTAFTRQLTVTYTSDSVGYVYKVTNMYCGSAASPSWSAVCGVTESVKEL